MARKRIGVFMSEITQFFQKSSGQRIVELAAERDMDVFFFASYGSYLCPYGRNLLSEIGKKNIIYLPNYSSFDAIIALPNSFDIYGMDQEFYTLAGKYARGPVICLQNGAPDFYTISVANKDSMYRMTKHFIEEHKFTKIAYMSGPFKSKDSPARLAGFLKAMEEAGIETGKNSIFEGNYWTTRGAQAVEFFSNGGKEYPQAIICANDYMAISVCDELKKRGLRVPEDVCVSGFDGILEGAQNEPSLTTVTVKPEDYADMAFKVIDDLSDGIEYGHDIPLSAEIELKKSCGCADRPQFAAHNDGERVLRDSEALLREAGKITADYQNDNDIENSLSVANYYFSYLGCDNGYLCLCDENDPLFKSVEQDKIYSDDVILSQKMRADRIENAERINQKFSRRDILPLSCFDTDEPQAYFIFPLYFKNSELGYLVMNPSKGQWPNALVHTYINALSSAIENSYYHNNFMELAEIKRLFQTDPLTGLFNRRGFENGLQGILAGATKEHIISFVSIDMDDLKQINDCYGHADGDFALKTLSEILKSCLRENEICARFGGDEFAAVLTSETPGRGEEFENEFNKKMSEASEKTGKPYPFHASIGICNLKGSDTGQVFKCMQIADEKMYENKRSYKKHKLEANL